MTKSFKVVCLIAKPKLSSGRDSLRRTPKYGRTLWIILIGFCAQDLLCAVAGAYTWTKDHLLGAQDVLCDGTRASRRMFRFKFFQTFLSWLGKETRTSGHCTPAPAAEAITISPFQSIPIQALLNIIDISPAEINKEPNSCSIYGIHEPQPK